MLHPVAAVFKEEFDRFHDLLAQQIDICPSEEAWNEKLGKFAYWWHLLHAFAIVELYALPPGAPSQQTYRPSDVAWAKAEPDRAMTRDEMRALAASMKELAYAFFASQNEKTFLEKNETMTARLGKEKNNMHALIGLVRHYVYHIGCIDSHLRARGIPGLL